MEQFSDFPMVTQLLCDINLGSQPPEFIYLNIQPCTCLLWSHIVHSLPSPGLPLSLFSLVFPHLCLFGLLLPHVPLLAASCLPSLLWQPLPLSLLSCLPPSLSVTGSGHLMAPPGYISWSQTREFGLSQTNLPGKQEKLVFASRSPLPTSTS